jgi:hypothetical protein
LFFCFIVCLRRRWSDGICKIYCGAMLDPWQSKVFFHNLRFILICVDMDLMLMLLNKVADLKWSLIYEFP